MNGGQDLGGVHGLGPVRPEPNEPVFHAEWERRAMALTIATGMLGRWNIDRSRHARENRHPAAYLTLSYYELWLAGITQLLAEEGLVSADELAAGRPLTPPSGPAVAPTPDDALAMLARGGPTNRPITVPPRFQPGAQVRVRLDHPTGHTRAPGYLRGRIGAVLRDHGGHVFPDTNALGRGERPERLYTVAFAADALWGAAATPRSRVMADLWDSYLEPT
jgi:nitrile hydratase